MNQKSCLARKARSVFFVVVLAAIFVVGCSSPAPSPTAVPATPTVMVPATVASKVAATSTPSAKQKLTIAVEVGPRLLDPNDQSPQGFRIYRLLFDKLVEADPSGKVVGSLAESWRIVDSTTWEFKLKKGVTFHNGEPFNAQAVKWTIDFNLDSANNRMANTSRGVRDIKSVAIVDDYTVNIVTKTRNATLLANLTVVDMLPAKYYAQVGATPFNDAPVGSGPYKFVDWKRDNYIKLTAYDGYWGKRPTIRDLEFRIIPEASARAAALRKGEVDVMDLVPPEVADVLTKEGFQVVPTMLGQSLTFMFGRETQRLKPFQDVRVRQAVNYAIDKDSIIKNLSRGWARKLEGQLAGPDTFGYSPAVTAYPYDPNKAKQLLAEAGYAAGFSTPLKCTNGRYFLDKQVCEVLTAQLAAVGITANMEILESSVFGDRFLNNKLDEGGLWVFGPNTLPAMDATISLVGWTSNNPFKFWASQAFDELYVKQNEALDQEARLKVLQEIARVMKEEAAGIFLYQVPTTYSMGQQIQGLSFRPDGSIDFSRVVN